jgi:hypothetical protein
MGFSSAVRALAHDAMHRLPGMPDHARAAELNARHHTPLRNRPLRNRPLRNRPLQNLGGRHGRRARVLVGWQAWIGQRFGQGQQ